MPDFAPESGEGYKLESSPDHLNFQSFEVIEVDESNPWSPALKVKEGEAFKKSSDQWFDTAMLVQ